LVTVPETTTVLFASATCGLIESIASWMPPESVYAWAGWALLAWAGKAVMRPTMAAVAAASIKLRTLDVIAVVPVLLFALGTRSRYARWPYHSRKVR
jgi:hypothetical protein